MGTEIVPLPDRDGGCSLALPELPKLTRVGLWDLYAALLSDADKPTTKRARVNDVADLARFLDTPDPRAAVVALVRDGAGQANAVVTAYKESLLAGDEPQSPATINRKLSTLRRLSALGRRYQLFDWTIDVECLKSKAYRDTKGPGRSGWLQLEAHAAKRVKATAFTRWKEFRIERTYRALAVRDYAILLLLYDLGLRRGEVSSVNVEDWMPDTARLGVQRKGRLEKTLFDLPGRTCKAIEDWLEVRGAEHGPMFVRLDHAADGAARLSGNAIWDLILALGKDAGLKSPVKPHGIRHQAITHAAELTKGDITKVQKFGGHADPKTTMIYIDNLHNAASDVSKLLAEDG